MPHDVSRAEFDRAVARAIAGLPEAFAAALESEVRIEVVDRPSSAQLKSVGLSEDELLLGLYFGVPRPDRSVEHSGRLPDAIYLFYEDACDASESGADLVEQVRVTLLHELGHHFGFDEDELSRLGYG